MGYREARSDSSFTWLAHPAQQGGAACHLQPTMSPTQTALSVVLGRAEEGRGDNVRRKAKARPRPPAVCAAGQAGSSHELRAVGLQNLQKTEI